MPRAKRFYIPGCIWHITHRCHKQEFLLKFARDRDRWVELLFRVKKKYGLEVLNYIVTSNHIHLLVSDNGNRDTIPRSMQVVAGQTAQEYNMRKKRKGAYWEDRYHATAVQADSHFISCLVYIDMNMVRTGVVSHPSDWRWSGFNEIQSQKKRYAIVNYKRLCELLGVESLDMLKKIHSRWIDETIKQDKLIRNEKWSQSIAVGDKKYVENIKTQLGAKAKHRKIHENDSSFELREDQSPYTAGFDTEIDRLSTKNVYFWNHF